MNLQGNELKMKAPIGRECMDMCNLRGLQRRNKTVLNKVDDVLLTFREGIRLRAYFHPAVGEMNLTKQY